jgi:hypothetical protein
VHRLWFIVEATTPPPENDAVGGALLQYGALGILALMALAAVRVLFTRMSATLDQANQRADRLEEELRRLNETIRTEYAATIARAAQAVADSQRAVTDASRRRS